MTTQKTIQSTDNAAITSNQNINNVYLKNNNSQCLDKAVICAVEKI